MLQGTNKKVESVVFYVLVPSPGTNQSNFSVPLIILMQSLFVIDGIYGSPMACLGANVPQPDHYFVNKKRKEYRKSSFKGLLRIKVHSKKELAHSRL